MSMLREQACLQLHGRRKALKLLCSAPMLAVAGAWAAESPADWPQRPIKLMVGFPPGGSTDTPIRVLAEAVSRILKQLVVVENRVGVGGTMPAQVLQASVADGYTLGISSAGINRLPFTVGIRWNPITDLQYILGLSGYAFGVVVPAASPIRTWDDFVAAAKKDPGMLTYSTPGSATTNHLTMEMISRRAGIALNHIPYKGSAESLQALLGGHVQAAAETSAWAPFVKEGKMRLLVTWGEHRMPNFPQVPTLKEVGIPLVQTSPWGLIAPKGLPHAIAAKLHDAFKQAMELPEFARVLAQYEMEPAYMSSQKFREYAAQSMQQEKEILELLGMGVNGSRK
jgi:tripartite-type tricarboxylate transporter receptor subunit TctC